MGKSQSKVEVEAYNSRQIAHISLAYTWPQG